MSNLVMIAGMVYLSLSSLVVLIAYCVCTMAGHSAEIGRLERMTPQQSIWLRETEQPASPAPRALSNQPAR